MFLREEIGLELAGGASGLGLRLLPVVQQRPLDRFRDRLAAIDWTPDLGTRIGSLAWWRGLATCAALCAATIALAPGLRPVPGDVSPPLMGTARDDARAQAIAPLAWGSSTGRRMAASVLVIPLAEPPERPIVDTAETLGEGDDFARLLLRAGVVPADARRAADLVADTILLADLAPGTRVALTLGPRARKSLPRPLEALSLRARFDLAVSLRREGDGMVMTRHPIAIDHTPLRLQGLVGDSLYRSARAAGAPGAAVESYIKALASRLSVGRDVGAGDAFDLVIERDRAATGETRLGDLLYAGLGQGEHKVQLVRWSGRGQPGWFDAAGQSERRGEMGMPVAGHITSPYGWRMHPLLGFMRMHRGLDIGAPYGAPVHAVVDGAVSFAGRAGGYGNFVKLDHPGNLVSGYGHLSRIAVRPGERVARGQVIGYVGSTGLSTGPHLHWEVWRNGVSVNPGRIAFDNVERLAGENLRAFKARVASLLSVRVSGAQAGAPTH